MEKGANRRVIVRLEGSSDLQARVQKLKPEE